MHGETPHEVRPSKLQRRNGGDLGGDLDRTERWLGVLERGSVSRQWTRHLFQSSHRGGWQSWVFPYTTYINKKIIFQHQRFFCGDFFLSFCCGCLKFSETSRPGEMWFTILTFQSKFHSFQLSSQQNYKTSIKLSKNSSTKKGQLQQSEDSSSIFKKITTEHHPTLTS